MAASTSKTFINVETPGVNQLEKRHISDVIRYLNSQRAPLTSFIKRGVMRDNKMVYTPGFIKAKPASSSRVELFTKTPIDRELTVVSVSSLDVTVSSADTCYPRGLYRSPLSNSTGAIDSISGSVLSFITIGDTTFAPVAGETLIFLNDLHEEGSSTINALWKNEDHIENYWQKFRMGIEISLEKQAMAHQAGPNNYKTLQQMALHDDAMKYFDRALFLSKGPASGQKTTLTSLGVDVGSMTGMTDWATQSFEFASGINMNDLVNGMAQELHETVSNTQKKIMLTGTKQWGKIVEFQNQNLNIDMKKHEYLGINIPSINTSRGVIDIIQSDIFNLPHMDDKAFIFSPDEWEYYYLMDKNTNKSHDLRYEQNKQDNAKQAQLDEYYAVFSLLPKDGGLNAMNVTGIA